MQRHIHTQLHTHRHKDTCIHNYIQTEIIRRHKNIHAQIQIHTYIQKHTQLQWSKDKCPSVCYRIITPSVCNAHLLSMAQHIHAVYSAINQYASAKLL